MKLKNFFAFAMSASMLCMGCSESGTDEEPQDPNTEDPNTEEVVSPTGISLNESDITLTVNDIYTLVATLTPSDAEGTITWSSSDESVATVSQGGAVMALVAGTTNIVATCESLTATCKVTVEEAEDNTENNEENDSDAGDNLFLYAFGYGPNGEVAEEGVDGSESAYAMTNSAVQTNQWDTQFCIVFGDNGDEEQGAALGYTYKVSMDVKSVGESIGLCPSINYGGSYLTTFSAWQETTTEWQEFAFEFEVTDACVTGNRLTFSIGDKVSTLYVDNISIIKVSTVE